MGLMHFILGLTNSTVAQPEEPDVEGYYVSEDGSGDGLNPITPMSIADFLALTLVEGDIVNFKRDDVFILGDKDISVDNITISAYGTGADPIIRGSSDISGLTWTDTGGGVYTTPMAEEPNWIWINGECAKLAQTNRVTVSSRGSTTTATVPNGTLDAYTSIVGAYLVIKEKNFQNSQKVTITAFDKTTDILTFDGVIPTTFNIDLVAYNDIEFLSGNNQWAWVAGTLYVRAAASPSTLDIRVGSYDYGFKTTGTIAVDSIEFKEFYQFAIWCDGGNPTVDACSFHDNRDGAIFIQRAVTGSSITDSTFLRIGNNAVVTRPCTDLTISGNTFTDIGMQENYNWQTWFDGDGSVTINNILKGGCGIAYLVDLDDDTIDGANVVIEYNTFSNLAYAAINLGLGTAHTIRYNIVTDFMQRYDDGGGIYTFHYRTYAGINDNTEIAYNIVEHTISDVGFGIYCDNSTRAAYVHHNTVNDCAWGILLNRSTSDHTVEDNNVIDCDYGIVWRVGTTNANPSIPTNINNQFHRNTIVCLKPAQRCLLFDITDGSFGSWNPYSGTGAADNNVYVKNAYPGDTLIADSDVFGNDLTLATLKSNYGEDASSVKLSYNGVLVTNPTNATSNEDAQSDYKDGAGSTLTTYTIAAYYSRIIYELNYSNTLVAASTQYFNAGTTADVQFTHTSIFSIAFRFKVVANPAGTIILIDNRNSSGRGSVISMNTSGFMIVSLTNTTGTNRCNFTDNLDVADNAWHHLLFVKKSSVASSLLYIDGADASPTISNTLSATIASVENWNIGRRPDGTLYYDGLIDDVAIWDVDMSAFRIELNNNGREIDYRTIGLTEPLHYWRMGKSGSLVDVGTSASPLNLTAVNSPTATTDAP